MLNTVPIEKSEKRNDQNFRAKLAMHDVARLLRSTALRVRIRGELGRTCGSGTLPTLPLYSPVNKNGSPRRKVKTQLFRIRVFP